MPTGGVTVDQTVCMRPTGSELLDVARIAGRVARAGFGGPPTQGATVLTVRATDRHVLLIRASYRRHWALPGGFLDPGEDPVAGGCRELEEETCVVLLGPQLLATLPRRRHVDHLVAGIAQTAPAIDHTWEIRDFRWVPASELAARDAEIHPVTRQVLRHVPGGILSFTEALAANSVP